MRLVCLSACSFPLIPMWLGSQIKLIFLLYLRIKSKISVRRFGLLIFLPNDIAYRELYKSLNIQISVKYVKKTAAEDHFNFYFVIMLHI